MNDYEMIRKEIDILFRLHNSKRELDLQKPRAATRVAIGLTEIIEIGVYDT